MMHPDLSAAIARQRMTELSHDVALVRARARTSRTPLRAQVGRTLVRWGHRPAPTPWFVGASTSARRPATMGP